MAHILILGGGAAGLAAALAAAQTDPTARVTVLERSPRPGKKLLATGNGRCNLDNEGITPESYSSADRAALNAVAAQLRCPYLLLEAGSNGTEIVALIRRMSLVIAMRLHTLIFAAGQGVPMVGVVYDPKVSGFLDYLGQDLYLPLEETNAASLCDLIDTAMAEQVFEAENIRSLRELAAENEELARHLLTEE